VTSRRFEIAVEVSEPLALLRHAHGPEDADAARLGDHVRDFFERLDAQAAD
jgi:hypothetical protein